MSNTIIQRFICQTCEVSAQQAEIEEKTRVCKFCQENPDCNFQLQKPEHAPEYSESQNEELEEEKVLCVQAETCIQVQCDCPYCNSLVNVLPQIGEYMPSDLRMSRVPQELALMVRCPECKNEFGITEICY